MSVSPKNDRNMKNLKLFYQPQCPFCKKALRYIDELQERPEYRDIKIEMIDELAQPELADTYDYYYVPTFYIDEQKVHEGGVFPDEVEAIFKKVIE